AAGHAGAGKCRGSANPRASRRIVRPLRCRAPAGRAFRRFLRAQRRRRGRLDPSQTPLQKGKSTMSTIPEGPLVTADWAAANLDNPKVRIFEVSVDPQVYAAAHIPGAVNLDWHGDLVDTVN